MNIREALRRHRYYDPHETSQAESLEGVALAEFWQRAAAIAIDFVLVLAVVIPIEVLWHYLMLRHRHSPPEIRATLNIRELRDLAWIVVYSGLMGWRTNGFTVGKRLLRIRVVSVRAEKITLWQAIERTLGYGASALEGGFGFFQALIHQNRQAVHDRIAETIVIKAADERARR